MHPSDIELPGIDSISETELARLIHSAESRSSGAYREDPPPPLKSYPPRESRARIVSGVLTGWIDRTEQLITAIGRTASLEPLLRDPQSLSRVYLCNAAELTEIRRIHRLRGRQAAVGRTTDLLEKHRGFLQGLHRGFSGSK